MPERRGSVVCEQQQEKFQLGCCQKAVTHGTSYIQRTQERSTRVAIKGFTVRRAHVTNHAGYNISIGKLVRQFLASRSGCRLWPHFSRHNGKRTQARKAVHIAFSTTRKP